MTKSVDPVSTSVRSFEEHDIVRTREQLSDGKVVIPEGSVGTIVFVHLKDSAFEVEFSSPRVAVVSVARRQIEAL